MLHAKSLKGRFDEGRQARIALTAVSSGLHLGEKIRPNDDLLSISGVHQRNDRCKAMIISRFYDINSKSQGPAYSNCSFS